MKQTAQTTGARPPYLTVLPPAAEPTDDGLIRLAIEEGLNGEELVLVTIPREPRLLGELRMRLGDRLRPYRVTPTELTFAVSDDRCDGNIIAIRGRVAYKLQQLGIDWSPHLMRSMAATEANAAGEDRAVISRRLGHVLVKTTAINYVALDLNQLRTSAARLARAYPVRLTASAISLLIGVSERQAKTIHARTTGDPERLVSLQQQKLIVG